jgi:hypothetical protein
MKNLPAVMLTWGTLVLSDFHNHTNTPNDGKYQIDKDENDTRDLLSTTDATRKEDKDMEKDPEQRDNSLHHCNVM